MAGLIRSCIDTAFLWAALPWPDPGPPGLGPWLKYLGSIELGQRVRREQLGRDRLNLAFLPDYKRPNEGA
jgi:hypothetical protein